MTRHQREALELGDRIAVMNDGRIEQIGKPATVSDRPSHDFVPGFIGRVNGLSTAGGRPFQGTPAHIVPPQIVMRAGEVVAWSPWRRLRVPFETQAWKRTRRLSSGTRAIRRFSVTGMFRIPETGLKVLGDQEVPV